ncbi:MAG TPA: HIT family protein [Candidatus Polarisedimenticolia bacterium]|nr:HIT family protein [Candidatus Polarisedimenticolia bacterium]
MTAGCLFCGIAGGALAAHVVHDDGRTLAFLDHRPLFPGHVLVIPREHHRTLPDLPDALLAPFLSSVRLVAAALPAAMEAEGTFVAMNNRVSQSVPHLHAHVVPRRSKDGLRGFFWPRRPYRDDAAMREVAERVRSAIAGGRP